MFRLYKKFTIFSFAKNINNSIHQYLKKRFAKDLSKLIIRILLSLVCPTVLRKYDLWKYFYGKKSNVCK